MKGKSEVNPVLDACFHEDVFSPEEQARYRCAPTAAAAFEDRGAYTMMLPLNEKTLADARAALDELWKIEEECRAGGRCRDGGGLKP